MSEENREENRFDDHEPPPPPMTASQKKFLAAAGLLLAAGIALGAWYLYEIGAFSNRPTFSESWSFCDPGDRCTAIRGPCDAWLAINEKHLDDARAYYDHVIALVEESPQMECTAPVQSDIQPKAYCLSGLCVTAQ
jgi:hypothetical protein